MRISRRTILWIATISTSYVLTTSGAYSQESPAQAEKKFAVEEITVTARKRDESLLTIPLTISVVTAADIQAKDFKELRDVVDYSPGFYFGGPSGGSNDRSSHRLLLRGMQVNTDVQTRQGATVFIDGAPILGAEIGGMESAERIETVKGPQSAYFGRSTFGGAINFITRNPAMDRWHEKVEGAAGTHGTYKYGAVVEGPVIADIFALRVSGSDFGNNGHYRNAAPTNGGQRLGDRSTKDAALTVFIQPTDNFSAKGRMHYWWNDDGPSASIGYGRLNGEDVFNCNPGKGAVGTARTINGNNWVCGEPRFPKLSEIAFDAVADPLLLRVLSGDATICPTCGLLLGPDFLTHAGFKREAREMSLNLEYEFSNDITLSAITASHRDHSARIEDFDRRATAPLGPAFNPLSFGPRALKDFSQEIRLSSSGDQKLHWLVGANYSSIKQLTLGVGRNVQNIWTSGNTGAALNKVVTKGLFGSLSYDIADSLTLSVEARKQDDHVTDGSQAIKLLNGTTAVPGIILDGTFESFTPRIILDYKPTDDITLYGIYAEGTRPGEFNSQLINPAQIDAKVLACIGTAIFAGINIPEEDLKNFEAGIKGRFLDGRATMTAAVYSSKWRNQHNRGQTNCPDINGVIRVFQSTGLGGSTDLQGVELEAKFAVTENLTIEGTFANNGTDILSRDCADCLLILGFREIAGLHKEFSRYPKRSGTLSAVYEQDWSADKSWFIRADYIHTGSQWATEANLAETGISHRLNMRLGMQTDKGLRVELYGTNLLNDKHFVGFQRFDDQLFTGFHLLTGGLPDKPTFGMRLSVGLEDLFDK